MKKVAYTDIDLLDQINNNTTRQFNQGIIKIDIFATPNPTVLTCIGTVFLDLVFKIRYELSLQPLTTFEAKTNVINYLDSKLAETNKKTLQINNVFATGLETFFIRVYYYE